jgi:hypothetical protein
MTIKISGTPIIGAGPTIIAGGTAGLAGSVLTSTGSGINWISPNDVGTGAIYTFYPTGGTWNKPTSGTFALVTIWGGGGSGGRFGGNEGAGGGGGGACSQGLFLISNLVFPITITVGSGAAAKITNVDGSIGGTSQFGDYLVAYGGGGGQKVTTLPARGGGGGGTLSSGSSSTPGTGHGSQFSGANGGDDLSFANGWIGQNASFGGAGGAGCNAGSSQAAGESFWGGGGGGAAETASTNTATLGGKSIMGGAGGAGSYNGTAESGQVPGGGGGGGFSASGAGGDGLCLIYVW